MSTLLVNLYGGPGSGKSTCGYLLTGHLKLAGINAEMAPEYAKDKVWENSQHVLTNQIYILGKQYHRIWRLVRSELDVVVTDSPILLSLIYGTLESEEFRALVREVHSRFDSLNVFLERQESKVYNPAGRMQTQEKAVRLDHDIRLMLEKNDVEHIILPANEEVATRKLVNIVKYRLAVRHARYKRTLRDIQNGG